MSAVAVVCARAIYYRATEGRSVHIVYMQIASQSDLPGFKKFLASKEHLCATPCIEPPPDLDYPTTAVLRKLAASNEQNS